MTNSTDSSSPEYGMPSYKGPAHARRPSLVHFRQSVKMEHFRQAPSVIA